jgi:hypothetical protein
MIEWITTHLLLAYNGFLMMSPWIALIVFGLSILDDVVVVVYMRRVVSGKRLPAALLSGALTALICLEVLIYVNDWIYFAPNALGSIVGTWIALWLEERLPKQTPRDSKGKFKPAPPKALAVEKERMV